MIHFGPGPGDKMKKLHGDAVKHLKEDIKSYKEEIKHLKKEMKEDKALIRKFQNGKR